MSKPTDIVVLETQVAISPIEFRAPLKFGGRIVSFTENMDVTVRVRTASGKEAEGNGAMPIGNVWAWPTNNVDEPITRLAVADLCKRVANAATGLKTPAHPIDHVRQLHADYRRWADEVTTKLGVTESMPMLAVLLAASPVDAALHDAFGKANGINCFNGLSAEFMSHDLAHYLDATFQGEHLDRYTLRQPKDRMPLYHLVGALDPLFEGDIAKRLNDGLPETLGEWIAADGLTHLKIKLNGENLAWDVERVVLVERAANAAQSKRGCRAWNYSLDFNEKCVSVDYVLDFLHQVAEKVPQALDRVQYIEQPTHRDLAKHRHNVMHAAAKIKPVVIDESLVDYESLLLARELGYSGIALKACKGQSEALLMAAAAQKHGMFLCVQDLTCPGASFLHSAELSARIPTVAAIEGNARQFCPKGNAGWADRFPSMFKITDGTLGTHVLTGLGLGH